MFFIKLFIEREFFAKQFVNFLRAKQLQHAGNLLPAAGAAEDQRNLAEMGHGDAVEEPFEDRGRGDSLAQQGSGGRQFGQAGLELFRFLPNMC